MIKHSMTIRTGNIHQNEKSQNSEPYCVAPPFSLIDGGRHKKDTLVVRFLGFYYGGYPVTGRCDLFGGENKKDTLLVRFLGFH
jgi:hypothetical protein